MNDNGDDNLIKFGLKLSEFAARVTAVVAADQTVFLGTEMRRQMFKVGIDRNDIVRCLLNCNFYEPEIDIIRPGVWVARASGRITGLPRPVIITFQFDQTNIFVTNIQGTPGNEL
jgi:hypothetical protein